MSLHLDALCRFRANQSLHFLLNALFSSREATPTNSTVCGLIRQGLEPTISPTQGEQANKYIQFL